MGLHTLEAPRRNPTLATAARSYALSGHAPDVDPMRPAPSGPPPYRPSRNLARATTARRLGQPTMINLSPPPRHLDASFDELLQRVHDRGRLLAEAVGSEGHHKLTSDSGVALVHGVPLVHVENAMILPGFGDGTP